eukprot:Opistho-1_new@30751
MYARTTCRHARTLAPRARVHMTRIHTHASMTLHAYARARRSSARALWEESRFEHFEAHRLGEEGLDARAPALVLRSESAGSEGDDAGTLSAASVRPIRQRHNAATCRDAVKHGHAQVHEHEIKVAFGHRRHCLGTVLDHHQLAGLKPAEKADDDTLIDSVVLGAQHAHASRPSQHGRIHCLPLAGIGRVSGRQRLHLQGRSWGVCESFASGGSSGRLCRWREREAEVKGASLADLALEPDGSTHGIEDAATDGQSQTCTTMLTCHRRIHLRESSKEDVALVLRDPNAGVRHAKDHVLSAVAHDHRRRYPDLAARGRELARVAQQIEQHLAHAHLVIHDDRRHAVRHAHGERQLLRRLHHAADATRRENAVRQRHDGVAACAAARRGVGGRRHRHNALGGGHGAPDVRDRTPDVEALALEGNCAVFELAEVEHVRDDREELRGRRLNDLSGLALVGREVRIREQPLRQRDDAVERRPHFV